MSYYFRFRKVMKQYKNKINIKIIKWTKNCKNNNVWSKLTHHHIGKKALAFKLFRSVLLMKRSTIWCQFYPYVEFQISYRFWEQVMFTVGGDIICPLILQPTSPGSYCTSVWCVIKAPSQWSTFHQRKTPPWPARIRWYSIKLMWHLWGKFIVKLQT